MLPRHKFAWTMDEKNRIRRHSARFICYSVRHEFDISIRSCVQWLRSIRVSTPFIMYYVCFFFFSFLVHLVCCCFYSMRLCWCNYSYFQLIAHRPANQWLGQTTLTIETLARYFCLYFYSRFSVPRSLVSQTWNARRGIAHILYFHFSTAV